jgi:hypothetical protein
MTKTDTTRLPKRLRLKRLHRPLRAVLQDTRAKAAPSVPRRSKRSNWLAIVDEERRNHRFYERRDADRRDIAEDLGIPLNDIVSRPPRPVLWMMP